MRKFFNEYYGYWIGNKVFYLNRRKVKWIVLYLYVNERYYGNYICKLNRYLI